MQLWSNECDATARRAAQDAHLLRSGGREAEAAASAAAKASSRAQAQAPTASCRSTKPQAAARRRVVRVITRPWWRWRRRRRRWLVAAHHATGHKRNGLCKRLRLAAARAGAASPFALVLAVRVGLRKHAVDALLRHAGGASAPTNPQV